MSKEFLIKFLEINPKKYIAPNIIMSLFADNVLSLEVIHYKRTHGELKWPISKLFKFGIRLIKDLKLYYCSKLK